MNSFRTLIIFSCFTLSGIFSSNNISAQTIVNVDSIPGFFNFRLGTPQSDLLKYVKPKTDEVDAFGKPKKKNYMVDMSLDKRYEKAFGNDIASIQLHFDSKEKLENITMSLVDVPMGDEPQFKTRLNSTYNFLKKLLGKYSDKLQSTEGLIYFWTGKENEVRFSVIPSNYSEKYFFYVEVLQK